MSNKFPATNPPNGWFLFLLLPAAALLSSCASPSKDLVSNPPEIKPGLILVTPDQAEHHGISVKTTSPHAPVQAAGRNASSVLSAPEVTAYSIGRYTDPVDPDLLHEAHVVYRREASARWRLDTAPSEQILIGPRLTDQRADAGPLQNKELDALLIELRKASTENRQAIELLFKAVEALTRQQELKSANSPATPAQRSP